MPHDPRTSVVVLTHNRADELERCLHRLSELPEQPPLIVVDNASRDGTSERVREKFPHVELVRCITNQGAAGRNAGVARVQTPYVAFCDDDTWWAPGSLQRAADLLDAHPRVGVIAARVMVGDERRTDPSCERMAVSPLDATGLPGPALIAFMAGAAAMRCDAFRDVGGYEPRLFLGAEELLLSLDLAARGWRMTYVSDVVTHHHPSPQRDPTPVRRVMVGRNRLWIAWLRLPLVHAWHESRTVLHELAPQGLRAPALLHALRGLPWVLAHRRVVPPEVVEMRARVFGAPARADSARSQRARA